MKNIIDVASKLNLNEDDLFLYGKYMAKIDKTIEKTLGLYFFAKFVRIIMKYCNKEMKSKKVINEESLIDLAELFKVFGDSTRIRILYALFDEELCVGDIAVKLNMTQSAISHQLKILKQSRLIKNRRDGKTIFYSLADDHVRSIIGQGLDHVEEE